MACNNCGNTTSNPCACKDTAYTIPANCLTGYSGQGCIDPTNNCEDIQCMECVKNCRGTTNTMNCIEINGQQFCMNFGESLEGFMQKLMLVLSNAANTAMTNDTFIAPFYALDVSSTSIQLAWNYTGLIDSAQGTVDGYHIRYALLESPNTFTIITNPIVPVNTNTYIVPSTVFPYTSGQTYIFQILLVINGYMQDGASATNLYITLP